MAWTFQEFVGSQEVADYLGGKPAEGTKVFGKPSGSFGVLWDGSTQAGVVWHVASYDSHGQVEQFLNDSVHCPSPAHVKVVFVPAGYRVFYRV